MQNSEKFNLSEIDGFLRKVLKKNDTKFSSDYEKKGIYPLFKKRLEQGYTEVSFGQGKWVNKRRIAKLYVFYNQLEGYMSYEYPEFREGNSIIELHPFEAKYTHEELQDHVNEFKIKFIEKFELAGLKLQPPINKKSEY